MGSPGSRSVLLRSSWQDVNIGDVAHSPGAMAALLEADPDARITLWPVALGEREEALVRAAFPQVAIVRGARLGDGRFTTPELAEAWDAADVLVYGSAPDVVGHQADVIHWARTTGKPHGYAGVTVDPLCPPTWGTLDELETMVEHLPPGFHDEEGREPLDAAEFLFTRDSISLAYLRGQGIQAATLQFGPDFTFAYDYADRSTIDPFLGELGIGGDDFACFVPRQRYAPYQRMRREPATRESQRRDAINAATSRADLASLVTAVTTWVRRTGAIAAVVPEMSYVPAFSRTELLPLLPEDVAPRVRVLDRFWSLAEASAIYSVTRAVVSMECHSPILASVYGTPTLYLRQPTETVKGRMYDDLGGSDLLIELGPGAQAATEAAVTGIIDDPQAWRDASASLNTVARRRLREMANTILTGEPSAPFQPALVGELAGSPTMTNTGGTP